MQPALDRRRFLHFLTTSAALAPLARWTRPSLAAESKSFEISLAEWSLHNMLKKGELDHLDYAAYTRNEFDISAAEYVDQFFADKAKDRAYLIDLKRRAADVGVVVPLIMIDTAGALGDADDSKRTAAVEKHYQWVEAANFLGCHSIRVNARSQGDYDQQRRLAADGLRRLSEFAAPHGIGVIVENHGGLSSNGQWLAAVIKDVDLPNCGTLPDFGNFRITPDEMYDRYVGVAELMPFAKAVSAKSYDFDAEGNETTIDYVKVMEIVLDAGYRGYVGIEYEGKRLSEPQGVRATKKLLERVRESLA